MKTIQVLILLTSIAALLADTPSELATENQATTIVDPSPTIYSVGSDGSAVPISTVNDPNGTGVSPTASPTDSVPTSVTSGSNTVSSMVLSTMHTSASNASSVSSSANVTSPSTSQGGSSSDASSLLMSGFSIAAAIIVMVLHTAV